MTTTSDLKRDRKNANRGTKRGRSLLEHSLREYGAGRSVLLDRHGNVIAGNKTVDAADRLGITNVIVVPTDGTSIVAVQRTDLDIDSARGRGLAYADNRVGELDLDWNPAQLLADMDSGVDLSSMFDDSEINRLLQAATSSTSQFAAAATAPQPGNNVYDEWVNMPEFDNPETMSDLVIKVHFANEADMAEFSALIGQSINPSTKYIWHPKQRRVDLTVYRNA